jgi:CubicO group peptidase (beta-lactamase class C family)
VTSLEQLVRSVTDPWAVPSGAVVITDRHGVVDEYHFGPLTPGGLAQVAPDTRFQIGSISKIVTALVVLRLTEQGLLSLDQTISSVLPWLAPTMHSNQLTIERLLQHSAGIISGVEGLPDPLGQLALAEPGNPVGPGTQFHYSNFGFLMLGAAASAVAGAPLTQLATELVLLPGGMDDALAAFTDADRVTLAVGTQPLRVDRPWWPGDPVEPAPWLELDGADGNVAASGRQLAALGRLLLNSGAEVVRPESFAGMIGRTGPGGEPLLQLQGLPISTSSRYGLGVNTERADGRLLLSHGGGMVGYASFLLVDPARGRAVAVATSANGDSPVAEAIARVVAAGVAIDLDPANWAPSGQGRARTVEPGMVGQFGPLKVKAHQHGAAMRLVAELDGVTSPLRWCWGDRVRVELPGTELYGLTFTPEGWACGGRVFGREELPRNDLERYCGHFRSYTPWFPHFRVVQRLGRLLMCTPGGVESPGEETELVTLGQDWFGLGSAAGPERIRFGGFVDGRAQWANRDGCGYSRSFTP